MESNALADELAKIIEIVVVSKRCVYINDYRVAGDKPYVSENLPQHSFTVSVQQIINALPAAIQTALHATESAPKPVDAEGLADAISMFAGPGFDFAGVIPILAKELSQARAQGRAEADAEIARLREAILEEVALAFEAEAETWVHLPQRGSIKRQGAKVIRGIKEPKP